MSSKCPLLYDREFDINDWVSEYNALYEDFKKEYIEAGLNYLGIPIKFKRKPLVNNRSNSFYHLTTGHEKTITSDEERVPDTKRIRKFYYPKIIINNYDCSKGCCSGILRWFEKKKDNKIFAYLYFNEEKYVVILEYRPNKRYFLFKTAYYVNYRRQRELFIESYEKNKEYNPLTK